MHLGLWDTEAGIVDGDGDGFFFGGTVEGEGDVSFGAVVFDCVGEQVDEHLFQALRVGEGGGLWVWVWVDPDADVVSIGEGSEEVGGFEEEGGQRDGDGLYGHSAGFDAGDIEDFVDEGEEVFAGFGDMIDAFDLFGVVGAEAEELSEA